MAEKRPADPNWAEAELPLKKVAVDSQGMGVPAPAAAAAAPTRPSLSLEALEKAKRVLQLQLALKEKMKKLPQVPGPRVHCFLCIKLCVCVLYVLHALREAEATGYLLTSPPPPKETVGGYLLAPPGLPPGCPARSHLSGW